MLQIKLLQTMVLNTHYLIFFLLLSKMVHEVIIPAPYWVTYPELVKYCGGKVVEIETDDSNEFKITPEQLKAAITD